MGKKGIRLINTSWETIATKMEPRKKYGKESRPLAVYESTKHWDILEHMCAHVVFANVRQLCLFLCPSLMKTQHCHKENHNGGTKSGKQI